MRKESKRLYEFNEFRLNVAERLLQRHGRDVPLPPKVFDLLLALMERHGQVVAKDQLLSEIWPDTAAIAALQKAEQLSKGGSAPMSALAHVYAVAGRRAEAEQVLSRLLRLHEQKLVSPLYVAVVYAGLGDREQTFGWLEKIRGQRIVTLIRTDPRFDPLRDDPRFDALLPR